MKFGEYILNTTETYEGLGELFTRNDAESSGEEDVSTDIIKMWEARHNGELVGGCILAMREGRYIINGIAVDEEHRGTKLGKFLLDTAVDEMKKRGGQELYIVARLPGFYRKQGFTGIPKDEAPRFFECFGCPQYNVSCFPEIMRLVV
ncbi:hypothetical protein FACS1894127_5240 [Clostridia bacterium]|nr:hypothetical protein FACS1894127_5240 [Clostridia bacterium]